VTEANHSEDQSFNTGESASSVREMPNGPQSGSSAQTPSNGGMVTSRAATSTGPSVKMIAIGVAVVLVAFISVLATRKTHSNDRASRVLGQAAPQITGTSLLDGKPFDLQAQQGKFVVVNYFATWCPPCVLEHPELVKFSETHPEVSMVSVVFQDNVDGVRKFFAKRGGTWPVLDSERAAVDFGVRGVPETYLISPAGQLIFQTNGGVTQKALEKAINRSSAPAATPTTTPAQ
jgi:cytochrome c biogenesis protein CcmG, thiol:disulfide interchange protein DsbE